MPAGTKPDSPRPTTARGEATRQKILQAAEHEFGQQSFFRASVSDITHRAGIAQGTFYIYFETKQDVFRELVRHMGREVRRMLTHAVEPGVPRLVAKRQGLAAFMRFVAEHENLYRVVQQAQFVDEDVYKASLTISPAAISAHWRNPPATAKSATATWRSGPGS